MNNIINYKFDNSINIRELIKTFLNYLYDSKSSNDITINNSNKLHGIVLKRNTDNLFLEIDSIEYGKMKVILNENLANELIYISKLSNCLFLNFLIDFENQTLVSNSNSLIILEPNYKVDVTDISNCFQSNEPNSLIYMLNKFDSLKVNDSIFFGNLVNQIFDKLLEKSEISFDEIIEESFKNRILAGILVYKNYNWKKIKNKLKIHFENLTKISDEFKDAKIFLEPSIISNNYGIQGRLDALLYYKEKKTYEIIELKSSKSPHIEYSPIQNDQNTKGIWINHLIQVLTYNMILLENIKISSGRVQVLYSSEVDFPFRYVYENEELYKSIVTLRNIIVAMDIAISKENFKIFDKLNPKYIGNIPSYLGNRIIEFSNTFEKLANIEKKYFFKALSYLHKEIYFSNINSINFEYSNSISNIELIINESDFKKLYLKFKFINNELVSLRIGDQVLLRNNKTNKGIIHKGYIKELNNEYLVISLRNKLTISDFFKDNLNWMILEDDSQNLVKKLYPLLFSIFNSQNKNLLLGIDINQEFKNVEYSNNKTTHFQNEIIRNAISAEKYYLIQGPPGTGKTSKILASLAKYYHNQKKKTLIFAFTNRAVDQIEQSLLNLKINDYIRIGTKVNDSENLLTKLSEKLTFKELLETLENTSIFISTISSLITNQEIFDLYDFEIAIVDEASQIKEIDLVCILQKVKKFILIGDQKQLPSVSTLDKNQRTINSESLNNLEIKDFGESYFSRLIKLNQNQNLISNIGLLREQGRMDEIIMDLTNNLFYENKLLKFENINSNFKFKSQLYFLNHYGTQFKTDDYEANSINKLVKYFIDLGIEDNKIGIISPFKLQCRNIKLAINNSNIIVDTIERFQGSEKEIIIISFSTNYYNLIEQISSIYKENDVEVDRKLNVAISRSKKILIMIGNQRILEKSNSYNKMFKYLKDKNKIIDSELFLLNLTQYLPENN